MFAIVGLTILAQVFHARAQYVTANCTVSQDNWMINSLGQNPCRVAEFLSYPCNAWTVVPLNNSQYYTGAADNSCECNTVMYNLLSGCSICQGGSQQGWQKYSANCTHPYIGQYPNEILSTTAVPHWAYIDVSGSNVLDINQAMSIGDTPETTEGAVATASVITTTVRVTETPTNGSHGSSKSIAGPVVGGIVGGLALIALVLGGVLFWTMRRGNSAAQFNSPPNILGSPSTVPSSPRAYSGASFNQGHVIAPALRIYEPYDPQPQQASQVNNNAVSMYVTPATTYKQESPTNMYRPKT